MSYLLAILIFICPQLSLAESMSAWEAAHEPAVKNPGGVKHEQSNLPGASVAEEQNLRHDQQIASQMATVDMDKVPVIAAGTTPEREARHHHHDGWKPRYNYYGHQYHMYPYVYVSTPVPVSSPSTSVTVNDSTYYYDQGTFYENKGKTYSRASPPVGAVVPSPPLGCARIVIGTDNYCFSNGVYYKEVSGGYQVAEPVR